MSTKIPTTIAEENISYAWGRAFLFAMDHNRKDLTPLTISVGAFTNNTPAEDLRIRQALDATLAQHNKYSCAVSAMLIFPFAFWNRIGRPNCKDFSERYLTQLLPRLKARDSTHNRRGTYFERMIAFRGDDGQGRTKKKNQLEHIIKIWHRDHENGKRPLQSALQVACFDPAIDQNGAALSGFPCLQQVSFAYNDDEGLAVNAYYPTQYIFDRAYGNYLGLCHLGHFMAHELHLQLVRLNCFIGCPQRGDNKVAKGSVQGLVEIVRGILCENNVQPGTY